MKNYIKSLRIASIILIVLISVISCKIDKKSGKWAAIEKTVDKWESFELLPKTVKAVFPKRPISKSKAFDSEITVFENYAEADSVTYSITLITHKGLMDALQYKKFMEDEVLAFKSLERKNIKIGNRDAVLSKVRENELCSYTINVAIEDKYIANIGVRFKGDFPSEKLLMSFAEKVKF